MSSLTNHSRLKIEGSVGVGRFVTNDCWKRAHVLIHCFKIVFGGYKKRKTTYCRKFFTDHESMNRIFIFACPVRDFFKVVFQGVIFNILE